MRLKTEAIHALFVVFSQGLDGYDEAVGEGKERKAIRKLFDLGALRLEIAINANKLKPVVQGFEEANNALIREHSGGKNEFKREDGPAAFDRYLAVLKEMTEAEHEVDIKPLSKAALKLDINPIPVQALMVLAENGLLAD